LPGRWVPLREHWRDRVLSLLVGSIYAAYLGPLVATLLEPVIGKLGPNGDGVRFSSFVVGIGGMSISGLIIDIFPARRADTVRTQTGQTDPSRKDDDAQP
jgi:hypothetical protein